jgi:hypothetical protein
MVPVVPIIIEITFIFTFHMRCISIVRSLYFRIFSASFLINIIITIIIAAAAAALLPFCMGQWNVGTRKKKAFCPCWISSLS